MREERRNGKRGIVGAQTSSCTAEVRIRSLRRWEKLRQADQCAGFVQIRPAAGSTKLENSPVD